MAQQSSRALDFISQPHWRDPRLDERFTRYWIQAQLRRYEHSPPGMERDGKGDAKLPIFRSEWALSTIFRSTYIIFVDTLMPDVV